MEVLWFYIRSCHLQTDSFSSSFWIWIYFISFFPPWFIGLGLLLSCWIVMGKVVSCVLFLILEKTFSLLSLSMRLTPVLWQPHAKSWLIGKDSDAGRDWGQEEKGMTEDEMAGWHHWLNGHESEWTPGVGDEQGDLACCDPWDRKESDTTERLNWTELNWMRLTVSLAYIWPLLYWGSFPQYVEQFFFFSWKESSLLQVCFFASIEMIILFSPFYSINMVYYTDWFVHVEPSLHHKDILYHSFISLIV